MSKLSPELTHVWQGRYKSFIIQDDDHLLTVSRYIEANPVRAGLAAAADQWPWSSHVFRTTTASDIRPDTLPIVLPDDWAGYVNTPITDTEIEKLRNCVNRQAPFGKEDWRIDVCEKMGLESTIRQRGWLKGRKRAINK